MDRKPDNIALKSTFEMTPLQGDKGTDDSASRKDTPVARSPSGQLSEEITEIPRSTEDPVEPVSEVAGTSCEKSPAPEVTDQVSICAEDSSRRSLPVAISTSERMSEETTELQVYTEDPVEPVYEVAGPSRDKSRVLEVADQVWNWIENSSDCSLHVKVILHSIIVILPLTLAVAGLMYILKCPANPYLAPIMLMAGAFGIWSIVIRCIYIMWPPNLNDDIHLGIKIAERITGCICLVSFIAYNCMLYSLNPSYDYRSEDYCNYSFYNFALRSNYVTIVFVVSFILWQNLPRIKSWFC